MNRRNFKGQKAPGQRIRDRIKGAQVNRESFSNQRTPLLGRRLVTTDLTEMQAKLKLKFQEARNKLNNIRPGKIIPKPGDVSVNPAFISGKDGRLPPISLGHPKPQFKNISIDI